MKNWSNQPSGSYRKSGAKILLPWTKKKNHHRDSRREERCSTCDIMLDQARSVQGKSDPRLQDGQAATRGQRRKAVIRDISGVDHWGVTNLSAPIWFTGQGHCTVFRHVMQLSSLVLCWKSTLTVILPQIEEKRSLSNVGHRGTKAENLAWHSTG